jgi:hypothetical protein
MPAMRWRKVGETIHLSLLGAWLGAIVMMAAGAAIVFPTMRTLDPTLGVFAGYDGDHAMLGAGRIAAGMFAFFDLVQFVCAFGSFATLGLGLAMWIRPSVSGAIRVIAMSLAMALVCYWMFIMWPRMVGHLDVYWSAAGAGDDEAAETARRAFQAMHPTSTRVMAGLALLVLASLLSGCWSALGGARSDRTGEPSDDADA